MNNLKEMKQVFKLVIGLISCICLTTACSDEEDGIIGFSIDKTELTIGAEGGTHDLLISSETEWVAITSEPWLMVSPANGIGVTPCTVTIDSTLINDVRTATIEFSPLGKPSETISVYQTGFGKMISIEEENVEIEYSAQTDKRYIETMVTTNVAFDVIVEYEDGNTDWLTPQTTDINLEFGARPRTTKVRFDWRMNIEPSERIAKVNFVPKKASDVLEKPAVLTITQKAAPLIEDNRSGDSLALLIIYERLNVMSDSWDTTENLMNWNDVTLWEKTDENLPCEEAIGRVKYARFYMFNTDETIPQEIRYLKYLDQLFIGTNVNTMLKSIELTSEICELDYLRHLELFSYGIVNLPDDFHRLGKTLEYLDISSNNFTEIPEILTPENFPKLKHLIMVANRRWTCSDLRNYNNYENGLGLFFNENRENRLRELFLWDNLEELRLSNNYIEGQIPDFTIGEDGIEGYTQADVDAFGGDTIQYVVDNQIPKILPNMKLLGINLNFLTGKIPDWMLYHPYFLEWYPEILLFGQQESGKNSDGVVVGFDNTPTSFEYYYEAFPLYRGKYEFNEEKEE